MKQKLTFIQIHVISLITFLVALYFFIIPLGILINDLRDPGLYNGEMPRFTYRWHRELSEKFATWAHERVTSRQATTLSTQNISGTEWPIFSSVYFLWATESLQDAWEKDQTLAPEMPKIYAQDAIEAAAALISDPNHATWVKNHWGDNYLHQENIFYRMLLISGLTSYQKLLDDNRYEDLLLDQVDSLSRELDASPYGLLDDYPGQCYPIDILPAIAAIQRADEILDNDHSEFTARAIRAFEDTRLDAQTGLPAYIANSKTGHGIGSARGVGISYMLIWAPELWSDTAQEWYAKYEDHFWEQGEILTGIREFPRESSYGEWLIDVDAGPVIDGYGTAATAFGIGAARTNNRFDHAYPLAAEAVVASWPLPNGTLLMPRLLSNLSEAPYLGESALLFNITRQPNIKNGLVAENKNLPVFVYIGLVSYAILGIGLIRISILSIWRCHRQKSSF
ncbi:MAG: hypothetical protein GY805_24755 [Chloroflexi bacterium]|nr:hypothetical protein [Chloroflexota bacterium]